MDIYAKRASRIFLIVFALLVIGAFTFEVVTKQKLKKEFTEKTYAFAEATIDGDFDSLSKLFSVEEVISTDSLSDADYSRIYEIIQDSMTYEIQEDTWFIDKSLCSVTVSFTRLDYLSIYLSLEEPTIDEYISALENSDKTVTIDVVFYRRRADSSHPYSYRTDGYSPAVFLEDGIYNTADQNYRDLISFYSIIPKTDWA